MLEAVLTGRLCPAAVAQRTGELIGAVTGLPVLGDADPSKAAARVRPLEAGSVAAALT
jgi:hypothetical protein